MSNQKKGSIGGKGYYIALVLCAVAIGVSSFLYYHNQSDKRAQKDPAVQAEATHSFEKKEETGKSDKKETKPQPDQNKETALKTVSPVSGEKVADYAMDCLSYNQTTRDWRTHDGIDIAAESGTKVGAAADGTVYTVYEDDTMGTTVVLRHTGGYTTRYSSLAKEVSVKPGQTVKMGQQIGCVGQTAVLESAIGDHVHFSVSCNDAPVNPAEFLSQQ